MSDRIGRPHRPVRLPMGASDLRVEGYAFRAGEPDADPLDIRRTERTDMPLLMCPNDDAAMQTMERSGVQFDMCPTCRGVWLDRGELEKLMEGATADGRASAPTQPTYASPAAQAAPQPWGGGSAYRDDHRRDDYRRDDQYRHDDKGHYKKKKRDSIFDIFD